MKQLPKFAMALVLGALAGTLAVAADPAATPAAGRTTSVPLAANAPSSYVVQRGDTLWGIAAKFLNEPWYWPEVWYLNPEVKNPHRIYPGDTLRLVYDGEGHPQIRVERGEAVRLSPQVRSTPLDESIPAIPFDVVAAFMSKPTVVSAEDVKGLPYVVGIGDTRPVAGVGDVLYARGLDGVEPGIRYNLVHIGEVLKDPDDGQVIGYEGVFAGVGRVERAGGPGKDDLTKLLLIQSARETLLGDRLVRDQLEVPLDFVPHPPAQKVAGRIVASVGGTTVIGQYHVIAINRGKRDGLEPGHVLAIWQTGDLVKDRGPGGASNTNQFNEPFKPNVRLPSEHAGTMMVFKTYDRMSYGLVMLAQNQMHVGDVVKNP